MGGGARERESLCECVSLGIVYDKMQNPESARMAMSYQQQ